MIGRRGFLGAAAGALAGCRHLEPGQAKGKPIDEIPTPALLLDLDFFQANLRTMADHCRKAGRAVRPHAKTHKCPEIARRQSCGRGGDLRGDRARGRGDGRRRDPRPPPHLAHRRAGVDVWPIAARREPARR